MVVYLLIGAGCGQKELLSQELLTLINKVTHLGWLMQCIPPELVAGGDFFPCSQNWCCGYQGLRKHSSRTCGVAEDIDCEGIQHTLLVPVSNDTTVEIC